MGGMGAVFRAKDLGTGETVALKVLRDDGDGYASRFVRESRVLAELRHPSIVRYIAHGSTPAGAPYLAMEWLEGETLAQRLARGGLTIAESLALVERIASTLAVAHARGIIHRDIKPSNLFIVEGDLTRVKILDFGLAHLRDASMIMTSTGVMLGTPGYMAPEQVRGAKHLNPCADVFSLGCVLFACIAGKAPFQGGDIFSILAKILLEDTPLLSDERPDVPETVCALVSRMLAKDENHRPSDGGAVARDILAIGAVADPKRAPVSDSPKALTREERRIISVVFLGQPAGPAEGETLPDDGRPGTTDSLQAVAEAHGARLSRVANGPFVLTLLGTSTATDQATRAVGCALALRSALPRTPIAVATGRGEVSAKLPVGEVIDRAAALHRLALPGEVRIDELTAGLLGPTFDVSGDAGGLVLRGRREREANRTLLGRPSPCVGRERELALLVGVWAECSSEPVARAVLVTGAAGVGKSRVRHEFLSAVEARHQAVEVWIGRGDPMGAGSPFAMVAQALRGAVGLREGEPDEVGRQKLRARVGRHVPRDDLQRVTEFLGELVGIPFSDASSLTLRSARDNAVLMGDQMRRAWEDFVTAECRAQPVLIVLDDLHWGDLPTVKLIDAALRNLHELPLMVLALARPEVNEAFPRLWAERELVHVALSGITRKASEKLVREMLGKAPDATVNRLIERAGGNAFYLEELIRAVAEGAGDTLPETVLAMAQARLEALEPEARRVLRAASVFGQVFWAGGVVALLGGKQSEREVRDWLLELTAREVLTARGEGRIAGEEEYVFRHALLREAGYATLTRHDAALGHGLAATWLERIGERDAVTLAEHHERSGRPIGAIDWYRKAAEHALEGNDFEATVARAERGVACGAQGEALGALRLLQAEAHRWRGDFQAAHGCAEGALASLARGTGRFFTAAAEVVVASARTGQVDRVVEAATLLHDQPFEGVADGPHARALARAAMQLCVAGRTDQADSILSTIDGIMAKIETTEPLAIGTIFEARAMRAIAAGNPERYLRLVESAAKSFERAGDLRMLCNQRTNVGYANRELGAYAEAEIALREALAAAERMGLASLATIAKHNLGPVLAREGSLAEARALEEDAVASCVRQGDRWMEGGSRIYLAGILSSAGDFDGAEKQAHAALDAASGTPPLRAMALASLARLLVERGGRTREALGAAREAMDMLVGLGGIEEGESLVRLAYAESLQAIGQNEEAHIALMEAAERLVLRGEKIVDPRLRASFLERIPENARTLALARR